MDLENGTEEQQSVLPSAVLEQIEQVVQAAIAAERSAHQSEIRAVVQLAIASERAAQQDCLPVSKNWLRQCHSLLQRYAGDLLAESLLRSFPYQARSSGDGEKCN